MRSAPTPREAILRMQPYAWEPPSASIARDAGVEEAKAVLDIRQQPALAELGFHPFDLRPQSHVVPEERSIAFEFSFDQSVLNEHLARRARIDRAIMDASCGNEDEAI